MSRKGAYDWSSADGPPLIDHHSVAKHRVLEGYLKRYVQVLASSHRVETLRLNLVDGFSGGGLYQLPDSGGIHEGSPLIFLRSMEEAEAVVRSARSTQFVLMANFYFVERERRYLEFLRQVVAERYPHASRRESINFIEGEFENNFDKIVSSIKSRGRAHRSIFLLDQYGYKDVPLRLLRKLFLSLPKAEVLLTFAVDSLVDYLSDTPVHQRVIKNLGIENDLDLSQIRELKAAGGAWRFLIQSQLHDALVKGSGAKFFTPFFIVSKQSGRAYWLVHLSSHVRARDEMAKLHWQMHTYFTHHGGAGLNMLGYDPRRDINLTGQSFVFDEESRILTEESLLVDIPKIISARPGGITFFDLLSGTCNGTPATSDIYKETIAALVGRKELEVRGALGERRRAANRIDSQDVLTLAQQRTIFDLHGLGRKV